MNGQKVQISVESDAAIVSNRKYIKAVEATVPEFDESSYGAYEFGPLKTRQERVFKPAQEVIHKLKQVKQQQAEWQLIAGESWANDKNLVFTHENGQHLCVDSVYGCFKRIVQKLGIPDVRFHDLRHTFCTLAVESGTDMNSRPCNCGIYSGQIRPCI